MGGLPQSNATLLKIAGGGISEDYDFAEGPDVTKWEGEEEAYVRETVKTQISPSGGALNKAKDVRLIIPADLEPAVDLKADDEVTFVYQGETVTRKIQDWDTSVLDMVPHPTVRLHLYTGSE